MVLTMKVKELNRQQLDELKQSYVTECENNPSWGDLIDAPSNISDETIFEHYAGINFVAEDFLTYQLPFSYDSEATCPLFNKYLFRLLNHKLYIYIYIYDHLHFIC